MHKAHTTIVERRQRFLDHPLFHLAAADRANKTPVRMDEHLAAHMPRRGAFTARHGAQRGGFIIFLKINKGLINGFHHSVTF
jgi:hypothetical protein